MALASTPKCCGRPSTAWGALAVRSLARLFRRRATVDHQGGPGDEGRLIGGKIQRGGGDLVWLAHAPDRLARVKRLAHSIFLPRKVALQVPLDEGRLHRAWAEGVAADALIDEVDRDAPCHAQHRAFAGGIRQAPLAAD